VRVQGRENKLNFYEVLKVSPRSQEISDALRQQQPRIFKADKRLRDLEAGGGKSDEISNYRFSGGRWAKPSNRDIFGGVVLDFTFLCGILVAFFRDASVVYGSR
jgi:hypothetical protein